MTTMITVVLTINPIITDDDYLYGASFVPFPKLSNRFPSKKIKSGLSGMKIIFFYLYFNLFLSLIYSMIDNYIFVIYNNN